MKVICEKARICPDKHCKHKKAHDHAPSCFNWCLVFPEDPLRCIPIKNVRGSNDKGK